MRRSFRSGEFPASRLADAKHGRTVTVCIPALDEESTIGDIVAAVRRDLVHDCPVVDEILVMDDGSTDATARVAEEAGATVRSTSEVLTEIPAGGKGQAMWKGVHASNGDIVVFCDGDVRDFDTGFVRGLAGPLLTRDDVAFTKGFYERPSVVPGGGGRVTELMARPLIATLFPHLADLAQPLSGECAARRDVLESIPFWTGYSVDLGLLIEVTAQYGNLALVQCDLGQRVHRNRSLHQLGPQALSILQLGLARSGLKALDGAWPVDLARPGAETATVVLEALPPLRQLDPARKTA